MTLQQIYQFKQWHVHHVRGYGLELALCDAVLGAWVMGWMLLPTLIVLNEWPWLPLSLLLTCMPASYCALRRHLHQRGLLRCDWLQSLK